MNTKLRDQAEAEAIGRLIRERRSNVNVDPERPVPREMIAELLELATWAPNHKRTNPWRFAVVTGEARARLGALTAEGLIRDGAPPAKAETARTKFLRAPVILTVGSAAHDDPILHRENRDAVVAGVQNILLAATAMGLATKWTTGSTVDEASVKELVGLGPRDELVGLIYLGWPFQACPPSQREVPAVRWVER
jgi:nitroreductase